jgi:4-hydroxybenzoate polyprenyltransferase
MKPPLSPESAETSWGRWRVLRGLYRLGHPLPTFATAAAVVLFTATARNGHSPLADLIVAFLVFYFLLYSIGAMNDYCDEAVDRASGRIEKPLVAGEVPRGVALFAWIATAVLSLVAAPYFNFAAAAMIVPLWLAGLAYNFWAKSTIVSWLPFVFFYPSLPIWAFIAEGAFGPTLLLSYPLLGSLAAALNIANTLPDVERDRLAGVDGLTHRLGVRRGLRLLWSLLGGTIVLMALTLLLGRNDVRLLGAGLAVGAALLSIMIVDGFFTGGAASLQRSYYLSIVCAIVLGYAWIASLS